MEEKEKKDDKLAISTGQAIAIIFITVFMATVIMILEVKTLSETKNIDNTGTSTKVESQATAEAKPPVAQKNEKTQVAQNKTAEDKMEELSKKIRQDEAARAKTEEQKNENTTPEEGTKQEIKLENYKGEWYKSKNDYDALKQNLNPDTLRITSVKDDKITFDFYVTRTGDFNNVSVSIEGGYGTFEANTENGLSTDKNKAKISGSIKFFEKGITLEVFDSNVQDIIPGTQYEFKYKK